MGSIRKQFGKEFKAKVAFEALQGLKTSADLTSEFGPASDANSPVEKRAQRRDAGNIF